MNGKDSQVRQTKQMICRALLHLMERKDFSKISVTDIIEKSQTSRRTFYRHFRNKIDLLDFYFQELVDKYLKFKDEFTNLSAEESILASFRFWYDHRISVKLIIDNQLFHLFMIHWNERALEIAKGIHGEEYTSTNAQELTYILRYSIGGLYNFLWEWLKKDNPESPEIILGYYQKLLKKMTSEEWR